MFSTVSESKWNRHGYGTVSVLFLQVCLKGTRYLLLAKEMWLYGKSKWEQKFSSRDLKNICVTSVGNCPQVHWTWKTVGQAAQSLVSWTGLWLNLCLDFSRQKMETSQNICFCFCFQLFFEAKLMQESACISYVYSLSTFTNCTYLCNQHPDQEKEHNQHPSRNLCPFQSPPTWHTQGPDFSQGRCSSVRSMSDFWPEELWNDKFVLF